MGYRSIAGPRPSVPLVRISLWAPLGSSYLFTSNLATGNTFMTHRVPSLPLACQL